jgi:alpha-galactosidase
LTLGLPNFNPSPSYQYTTNNGTLQQEVWAGPLSTPGKVVVVLFNKGPVEDTLAVAWDVIGLPVGATLPVRDVYNRTDLPPAQALAAVVQPHGVRVFVVG